MSSIEDNEESWEEFCKTNQTIPPHPSRRISTEGNTGSVQAYCFCINLKSVELDYKSEVGNDFQLRATFYDAANHYFFGSSWIGPSIRSEVVSIGKHMIHFNDLVYFHSSIKDVTITLVIELVDTGKPVLQTVGWLWLRIFSKFDSLTDINETARAQERRVEFYHGSPLALLQIPEPLEECQQLRRVNSCLLLYTLQTHEQMENVLRYIPENVPISGDDIIPGIEEVADDDSEDVIDVLRSPIPMRLWPCHLSKCTIMLMPSMDKFEDYLCTVMNNERLIKDELQPDGCVVRIAERKLKVGVHNGWNFVQAPHVFYLEKEKHQISPNKIKKNMSKPGSRPGSSLSNNQRDSYAGLTLRGRVDLNEMIHNPLFAIVFLLEYVINIPVSQPEIPAGKKARNKLGSSFGSIPLAKKVSVAVRIAAWCPFEHGQIPNQIISLEMKGSSLQNPFDGMVFNEMMEIEDMHFGSSLGIIEFNFNQTKLKRLEASSLSRTQSRDIVHRSKDEDIMFPVPMTTGQMMEKKMMSPRNQDASLMLSGKPPLPGQQRTSSRQQQQQQQQQYIQEQAEAPYLEELPRSQLYSSLVIPSTDTPHIAALSRVAHSLLYSVDYPSIKDAQGESPFVINPEEKTSYNLSLEHRDPLHTNEIVLQFLAVSRCVNRCVFFTFQFYRFPQTITERLHLKKLDEERAGDTHPCVLQRSARDGKPSINSPPGLTIKYTLDPAYMQAGEKNTFLQYLLQQKLYIDMWDGDSLLLIGSTSTPLKYLLRQSKPAVQVSQELDVVFTEYAEDHPTLAGDLANTGLPAGIKVSLKAKLCVRMGNIGFIPETNLEKLEELTKSMQSSVVLQPHSTMIKKGTVDRLKPSLKETAKLMSDCDSELASVLLSRKPDTMGKSEKMKKDHVDSVRKRKLNRMMVVRQVEGSANEMASGFILLKEEKVQRTRDLRTIQMYRDKVKNTNIQSKLEDSITTKHILHSSLGQADFFEYVLRNPSHRDQVVYIKTNDNELKVVTNSKEWRYFKQLNDINTAIEDQMFSASPEEGVKLFLRGNESVHVPFKFQSFTSFNATPEMGPSHPLYQENSYSLQTFGKDTTLSSKEIKVMFTGNEMKPLAFLMVAVELHPHTIHQTFRFYHPEQTFLKKAIRLPPFHAIQGASSNVERTPKTVTARCNDESVICETHQVVPGEPQEVFLKVPCGVSPNIKRFFIIVFIDEYCSRPCQIWQFYVHSLQRIDMTVTEGQTSKLSVLLKGTQSSRMVKCFPSHPAEIKVNPHDAFMLTANSVQEVSLKVNPLTTGRRMMFLNVVDQEFHQLIKSWLLMVVCREPCISKAFEVVQFVGGGGVGSNKKISFTNPYPVKKTFKFHTNRPDLLKFKENGIMLGGGESHNICLSFLPQQNEGESTILVFISDRDGKNEETFCIKVVYRKN